MNGDDAARKAFFVAAFVERYGWQPTDTDLLLYIQQMAAEDESRIAKSAGPRPMAELVARIIP